MELANVSVNVVGSFKYRSKSLNASSTRFGKCEVCHEHASEMFIQSKTADDGEYISTTFGHEACLSSVR